MFKNYLTRKNDPEHEFFSEEMIVEGIPYALIFIPNGMRTSTGTHISVGIERLKLPCLNLDTNEKVFKVIKMLHSTDRHKDF